MLDFPCDIIMTPVAPRLPSANNQIKTCRIVRPGHKMASRTIDFCSSPMWTTIAEETFDLHFNSFLPNYIIFINSKIVVWRLTKPPYEWIFVWCVIVLSLYWTHCYHCQTRLTFIIEEVKLLRQRYLRVSFEMGCNTRVWDIWRITRQICHVS